MSHCSAVFLVFLGVLLLAGCGSGSSLVKLSHQDRSRIEELQKAGKWFGDLSPNQGNYRDVRKILDEKGYHEFAIAEYQGRGLVLVEPESARKSSSGRFAKMVMLYVPSEGIDFVDRSRYEKKVTLLPGEEKYISRHQNFGF